MLVRSSIHRYPSITKIPNIKNNKPMEHSNVYNWFFQWTLVFGVDMCGFTISYVGLPWVYHIFPIKKPWFLVGISHLITSWNSASRGASVAIHQAVGVATSPPPEDFGGFKSCFFSVLKPLNSWFSQVKSSYIWWNFIEIIWNVKAPSIWIFKFWFHHDSITSQFGSLFSSFWQHRHPDPSPSRAQEDASVDVSRRHQAALLGHCHIHHRHRGHCAAFQGLLGETWVEKLPAADVWWFLMILGIDLSWKNTISAAKCDQILGLNLRIINLGLSLEAKRQTNWTDK